MNNLAVQAENDIFTQWLLTIEARFSIQIDESRQEAFRAVLQRFAESLAGDLSVLEQRRAGGLITPEQWDVILHLATNHETRFFRSPTSIQRIVELCSGVTSPKILSVGCSSGEEPYSIASALLDAGHATFRILGTDVSAVCIETARHGLYPYHPRVSRRAAVQTRDGRLRFHQFVKNMVTFEQHNILQDRPPGISTPDIIITQNMLIYYRPETRFEILNRLCSMLPPGGHLLTGPGETLNWRNSAMARTLDSTPNAFKRSNNV